MKRFVFLIIVFLLCLAFFSDHAILQAQDFQEEFDSFLNEIDDEYQNSLKDYKGKFNTFTDSINNEYLELIRSYDKEFLDVLEEDWQSFELDEPFISDSFPKPLEPLIFESLPAPALMKAKEKSVSEDISIHSISVLPPVSDMEYEMEFLSFSFFGAHITFQYEKELKLQSEILLTNSSIRNLWQNLSQSYYSDLLHQLHSIRNEMKLNDWGYYVLIKKLSEELSKGRNNNSIILTWFLLQKSNYLIKIGYFGNQAILLLPAKQKIFGQQKIQLDNQIFYALDYKGEKLITYPQDYAGAYNIIDLSISHPPNFPENKKQRIVSFDYEREYSFKFIYNQNYIDFFKNYPLTELGVYLDAPFSKVARESFINQIMPIISELPLINQIEFLLQLVQNGFDYKSDREQFQIEKIFLGDEILSYTYSDCEDRAILFAKIVHELLGKEVVLLDFPGHVANAIEIPGYKGGLNVDYNGKKLLVCDPSYIHGPPGTILPEFMGITANIIPMLEYRKEGEERIISGKSELAQVAEFTDSENFIADSKGNTYLFQTDVEEGSSVVVLSKYDSTSALIWAKSLKELTGFNNKAITLDDQQNIFVAGAFIGPKSNNDINGLFAVVKINNEGKIKWVSKIPVDSITSIYDTYFKAVLSNNGELIYLEEDNASASIQKDFILKTDVKGNCILRGLFYHYYLAKADMIHYNEGGYYDIVSDFLREYKNTEKTTSDTILAFCWTLFSFLGQEGILINRDQLGRFIHGIGENITINSVFSKEQLQKIKSIENSQGIIQLNTFNNSTLLIKDIIVENEAKCCVLFLNDRMKIKMIKGFYKGNLYHRDMINFIDIMKDENQINIDYSNHYNKKLVMKADIL